MTYVDTKIFGENNAIAPPELSFALCKSDIENEIFTISMASKYFEVHRP